MPILNYTTTVAVSKSIMEIQECLVAHGARKILSDYDGQGNIVSISFQVESPYGTLSIRLPAKPQAILRILEQQKRAGKIKGKVDQEQALRVAWRILKDWVEAQMALLETDMVQMEEIFMPYVLNKGGQTMFEKFVSDQLMLGTGE